MSTVSVAAVRRVLVALDPITVFCAIPVGVLGLSVAGGWIVHSGVLIQILPGMSPMMFNTAVGLMLAAISLSAQPNRPALAMVSGGLLTLLGGMTLVEYAGARDLGIDQLLFRDWHGGRTPGRMRTRTRLDLHHLPPGQRPGAAAWLRVLYMSGYTNDTLGQRGLLDAGIARSRARSCCGGSAGSLTRRASDP